MNTYLKELKRVKTYKFSVLLKLTISNMAV